MATKEDRQDATMTVMSGMLNLMADHGEVDGRCFHLTSCEPFTSDGGVIIQ